MGGGGWRWGGRCGGAGGCAPHEGLAEGGRVGRQLVRPLVENPHEHAAHHLAGPTGRWGERRREEVWGVRAGLVARRWERRSMAAAEWAPEAAAALRMLLLPAPADGCRCTAHAAAAGACRRLQLHCACCCCRRLPTAADAHLLALQLGVRKAHERPCATLAPDLALALAVRASGVELLRKEVQQLAAHAPVPDDLRRVTCSASQLGTTPPCHAATRGPFHSALHARWRLTCCGSPPRSLVPPRAAPRHPTPLPTHRARLVRAAQQRQRGARVIRLRHEPRRQRLRERRGQRAPHGARGLGGQARGATGRWRAGQPGQHLRG